MAPAARRRLDASTPDQPIGTLPPESAVLATALVDLVVAAPVSGRTSITVVDNAELGNGAGVGINLFDRTEVFTTGSASNVHRVTGIEVKSRPWTIRLLPMLYRSSLGATTDRA